MIAFSPVAMSGAVIGAGTGRHMTILALVARILIVLVSISRVISRVMFVMGLVIVVVPTLVLLSGMLYMNVGYTILHHLGNLSDRSLYLRYSLLLDVAQVAPICST